MEKELSNKISVFMCDYWNQFPTLGSNEELAEMLIEKFKIHNVERNEKLIEALRKIADFEYEGTSAEDYATEKLIQLGIKTK